MKALVAALIAAAILREAWEKEAKQQAVSRCADFLPRPSRSALPPVRN